MRKHGLEIKPCKCSDECEHCLKGKMFRKPFPKKSSPVNAVLDVIVSDVCGPMPTESLNRKRYFLTFIDVFSGYCEVRFIREKSEVPSETIQFVEKMKNQLGRKPKIFRSDRGTEYLNDHLQTFLRNQGIKFECTVGYCPEQNGIAERRNRTLVEAARTMLSDSELPKNHWAEAINTANHAQNRIIGKSGHSPFERFFNKKPTWNELRRFGCEVYAMIPDEKRRKLDMKSEKLKFVGFDEQSKGFRLSTGRKIVISREVHFIDDKKLLEPPPEFVDLDLELTKPGEIEAPPPEILQEPEVEPPEAEESDSSENDSDDDDNDDFESAEEEEEDTSSSSSSPSPPPSPPVTPLKPDARRSNRSTQGIPPRRYDDYVAFEQKSPHSEPKTYKEAINSVNSKDWIKAMDEELENMRETGTWEVSQLPEGRKSIGSKWVFKTKFDANGNIAQRKARLVAQGFSQRYGVDYDEVFAPVARGATMRLLLSVAGMRKLKVKQYDIKAAFLNGKLKEEIFMRPPPGMQLEGKILRLRKSLYGLKQAARVWNQVLHESLVKNGCKQNETDPCLYSLASGGDIVYLLIHVDDILAATNNEKVLENLMSRVSSDFELKCLGEAKSYLGIQLDRDENGHFLISQPNYISSIIEAARLTDAKSSKFPLDTGYHKLDGTNLSDNQEYRKLIGMLLFLSTNSRPDISASVSILSQRVSNPRDIDMNEVKRIIRYLKGTQYLKLRLSSPNSNGKVFAYSDADWAESKKNRKSHSGMFCSVNGGAISWCCRKQDVVSLSTAEAEYIALSETCKEVLWMKQVMKHFDINPEKPVMIFTDNQSALAMVDNQRFSNRTKHIDTKFHFVRDVSDKGLVSIRYHPSNTNIADMLTKPLGGNKIRQLRELGGLQEEEAANCAIIKSRRSVGVYDCYDCLTTLQSSS